MKWAECSAQIAEHRQLISPPGLHGTAAGRLRLHDEYGDWCWRARYSGGEFDFSDEAVFRRGVELFTEMVRKRYSRSRACTPSISRHNFGFRSILYRLGAKIDIRELAKEGVRATGWDRSEYLG